MAPSLPKRSSSSPPESLGSRPTDLPVDHALSLLLADEVEPALRWSAAALDQDPWSPGAIIVTARVLSQMGRTRAAIDGMLLAVQRAIESGDLPLAIVAIDQLRGLGVKVNEALDDVANAFCRDSGRLHAKPIPRDRGDFQPLSPLLTGEPLASKAAQILLAAKHAESGASTELATVAPLPLFSALSRDSLREFLEVLETTFVPSGYRLLQEGRDSGAAFIVATGTLEIARRTPEGASRTRTVLGRVGSGALVGEVALMSHLPSAASVIATTASILLVARRSAVEPVAAKHAELGLELAAFCRRHAVANLGWSSSLIAAVPAAECASLVERLETRTFERGEKLVVHGEDAQGLHLIVSGEVAVVAREGGGRVMLATRLAGETVGEVELVLCQKANVDAIAVRSTATLLLPPDEFFALVRESPATLHGLYAIAVRRHAELRNALEAGSAVNGDEWALDDVSGEQLPPADGSGHQLGDGAHPARGTPPPPLPREASLPTPTPPPVGSYDALNGSALRATTASRASVPSPFAPVSSFAPGQYGAPAGANANFVPPAASQAPASFIPPAPPPASSQLGATIPTPYPPPSPFTPPPNPAAFQGMPHGASVAPSVASAGFAPRSRANATMVLAAIMTVIAVVLLTMTVLGKRPVDLLGSPPAAGRASAPSEGAMPATENAPPAPAQPAVAAAPVTPALAARPPVIVPAFKVTRTAYPRSGEAASSSRTENTSSSSAAPAATSAAGTAATMAASAAAEATSSAPQPAPVSTPANASPDDFGGRQ